MRQLILIAALGAAGMAFTGCPGPEHGGGEGGGGQGGTAGVGGSPGTGGAAGTGGAGGTDFSCAPVPDEMTIEELVDSDFADEEWTIDSVSTTPGATATQDAVQQATGGVGDSGFRQMTHVINESTACADEKCTIVVYHRSNLRYDPSTEGAIAFIDYTETHRIIEGAFAGAAVGWAFYAEQDGTRYVTFGERTGFTATQWSTDSVCGIVAEDFTAEGLDFSTDGGPITFGFTRSNTNTSTENVQRNVHGIDDFRVVIVKELPAQ